ncbi:hypothetical protein Q8A67_020802 [Cirrhinus molitorella]|uniref:Uncharacterized protein n=1 Tax=Cirrhinus molitorella TaxID=172907 RepID=A0AA88PE39_9TELE|nr:hypothetical protein Q8A67_020802 [Cirrhinus molitorella]
MPLLSPTFFYSSPQANAVKVRMEQMPGQDSTTDFAKKRGKQKRLSLDEYAASLLQWLPSGIAASRAFQKTALAAVGFEPTPPKRLEP